MVDYTLFEVLVKKGFPLKRGMIKSYEYSQTSTSYTWTAIGSSDTHYYVLYALSFYTADYAKVTVLHGGTPVFRFYNGAGQYTNFILPFTLLRSPQTHLQVQFEIPNASDTNPVDVKVAIAFIDLGE